MYQAVLTRKYLTTKIMPLLASVAVMLCTAMVLITWSIMGGFLDTLLDSGRTMKGDMSIRWPFVGFAHYEDLIDRLEAHPDIVACTPVIEAIGMVKFPDDRQMGVSIVGVEGATFETVADFDEALWWRPLAQPMRKDRERADSRLPEYDNDEVWNRLLEDGRRLKERDPETGELVGAANIGIEMVGSSVRTESGVYDAYDLKARTEDGGYRIVQGFMPNQEITVTVIPFDNSGRPVDAIARRVPVANEFRTGIFDVDQQTVLIDLDLLQDMLRMDEAETAPIDPDDPFATPDASASVDPARVTSVMVKATEGVPLASLHRICAEVYATFSEAHDDVPRPDSIRIQSWEDDNATMIAAVKKETALVLFIFIVISITAVFLVLAIFWSMVNEKTKDIGILRSMGASRSGVAWLWVRYGGAIGIVGSALGGVVAYFVVRNINEIHDWLIATGRRFDMNWAIWDPSVYYFVEIPSDLNTQKAVIVLVSGVVSCMVGALIPAIHAARMDPVRALRFE